MDLYLSIVKLVDHLHRICQLSHLDLKLENFIVRQDTGQPVLIDFGMAEELTWLGETVKGTNAYMAPEVGYHNRHKEFQWKSGPADMWSLGIILYALVFQRFPYAWDAITKRMIYVPIQKQIKAGQKYTKSTDTNLVKLIEMVIVEHPSERASSLDVIKFIEN